MRPTLLCTTLLVTLALPGCSMQRIADNFPLVYRIDVQQGNVVDQTNVDQLRPNMPKRQVRFVMGTPLLVDVFHDERWDYIYRLKPGKGDIEHYRVSLFFEEDALIRVAGDLKPNPIAGEDLENREALVVVPVLPEQKKGLLDRVLGWFGFAEEDDL